MNEPMYNCPNVSAYCTTKVAKLRTVVPCGKSGLNFMINPTCYNDEQYPIMIANTIDSNNYQLKPQAFNDPVLYTKYFLTDGVTVSEHTKYRPRRVISCLIKWKMLNEWGTRIDYSRSVLYRPNYRTVSFNVNNPTYLMGISDSTYNINETNSYAMGGMTGVLPEGSFLCTHPDPDQNLFHPHTEEVYNPELPGKQTVQWNYPFTGGLQNDNGGTYFIHSFAFQAGNTGATTPSTVKDAVYVELTVVYQEDSESIFDNTPRHGYRQQGFGIISPSFTAMEYYGRFPISMQGIQTYVNYLKEVDDWFNELSERADGEAILRKLFQRRHMIL